MVNLQVTDAKEQTIELRCMMSARTAGHAFDLRCEVREKLIDFLQKHHPEALPHSRQITLSVAGGDQRTSSQTTGHGRAEPSGGLTGRPIANAAAYCVFAKSDGYPA